MNYKTEYLPKKPIEIPINKQLFAVDVNSEGAKNFIISTYPEIYELIKTNPYLYEDQTFSESIKLHFDIDVNYNFNTELERDLEADDIIRILINDTNYKLSQEYNINNPSVIVLISDTLKKLSLHVIYTNVFFKSIVDMKMFCSNISSFVDMNIYKRGVFRMFNCCKYGKQNKLIYYKGFNYKYINDYQLFIDSCICSVKNDNPISIIQDNNKNDALKKIYNNNLINHERNYIYKNYDINKITEAINKVDLSEYNIWFKVTCSIKDLWLSVDESQKEIIYNIYDNACKKYDNYDEDKNYNIFLNIEPKIDINYLFHLADIHYIIKPLFDYKKIMFNINNHKNVILQDSKYIDVNINKLLKYKIIYLKSPTGSGKTTTISKLLNAIKSDNILSVVSRVNLAREHVKNIKLDYKHTYKPTPINISYPDGYIQEIKPNSPIKPNKTNKPKKNIIKYKKLDCYKDIDPNELKNSKKLAVQLESICKISYKNFVDGVVILDEVNSLLSHLKSPTLNNIRSECYLYLCNIIKNAKYVICMDCDLSDWNIEFIKSIRNDEYVVYQNNCKNKVGTNATVYINDQILINKMADHMKNKKPFVSCFDSRNKMNQVIEHLSKFSKKEDWKIYSSDVEYGFINTKKWINQYVFYTPSILYGIDYNEVPTDVFSFTYKSHLNPLQIYQMISRTRKINELHLYCHNKEGDIKYNSIEDVEKEYDMFINNFNYLMPNYNHHVDEKSYKIMHFNFKYMDSLLKTNIKEYLIAILIDIGFNIKYNNVITGTQLKKIVNVSEIKVDIINLLKLDSQNLTDFQTELCKNNKKLEKHFNLRIIVKNNINEKVIDSISKNLFTETVKNKYTKIKITKELMNVLNIESIEKINKDLSVKYNDVINNEWLTNNIEAIKKTFEIRAKKYSNFKYYTIYQLLITMLKNLFDVDLFIDKCIKINKKNFYIYEINNDVYNQHLELFQNNIDFIDNI